MKVLIGVLFIFLSIQSPAQLLKNLKDRAINKAKQNTVDKAKTEARDAYHKQLNDIRDGFDSTDFDYAILVSDNSGLFDVKDKKQFGSKFFNLKNIGTSFYRKDFDISDEDNARLNLHSGESAYAMGRYLYAEKRFTTAAGYFEKAYLLTDPGYMKTISNTGLLYATMGRYSQAEKFTSKALDMRQTTMGPTDMGVAASLNNYAVLHYNLGQYNESEKDFVKALSVIEANQLQTSQPYAIVLNNQAMLFQALGRYETAEKNMLRIIDIGEKLGDNTKSINRLRFFSNLALLYQQMGKYTEAENIYLKMQNKIADRTTPEFANVLNNVAILYMVMNKQDRVEQMLQNSAEIYKKNFGENSPAYAKVISDLGNFYRYKGRYDEAEPLLTKALEIREQSLGNDHPLFSQSEEDMAILYWKTKNYDKAYELYHSVMEKSLDFINRYFPPMSESEKTKYWDLLSPRFQRFYNFAVEASTSNKEIILDLFEYRVATKGLLLSSTRKISQAILASGNTELINDYAEWIDAKEEMTKLYVFSKEDMQEQGINLDSLEGVVNAMEKKLSENSKEFSQFYFTSKIKYAEVQDKLKTDEALVEMIRLRNFDQTFTDSSRYLALVVTKNDPQPKVVVLQNGLDMEKKFFKAYRKSMQNKINDEQSYNYFWAPLESEVKGKKKIYVSLDGVYNQINLYTLKKAGGDFLINQYDIILIGNARDIVTDNSKDNAPGKKATLIGDPDYRGDKSLAPLPATKTEVDGINTVLKSSGYQVAEYTQEDATEDNLKSSKDLSILHIATHGFFFPDIEKASWPIGVSADNAKDNVLLRSGLVLTGVIESDKMNPTMDSVSNGVITSYEAMNLDLKGTKLVVLSACETGLGEVKAGEGVYGLQRAFLVAGADALIMSLWKVDDAATQQLMNNFYTNWTKRGDKQKAFKQAQLQLMTKYKEPYYWGAFVMMED
ncbi:MAG TPA: CHAT domain-containing tetratricopeptide repeat protein [Chitinophagaceae bacterium]|nr:CHAT domain-containing tetratricopeptide repeat protein [Chitinophagaceae bacterium]